MKALYSETCAECLILIFFLLLKLVSIVSISYHGKISLAGNFNILLHQVLSTQIGRRKCFV